MCSSLGVGVSINVQQTRNSRPVQKKMILFIRLRLLCLVENKNLSEKLMCRQRYGHTYRMFVIVIFLQVIDLIFNLLG